MKKKEDEIRQEAERITGKLTLEEKIGMVHGAELFATAGVPRLGIPPLRMSDGPMGVRQEFAPDAWVPAGHGDDAVSYLPCNSALAATWNPHLAGRAGEVLGSEARNRGKDVILAPGVNLKRSPLCGRNFEYFSEDPFLTASMAVPLIQGIQKWDVAACVKHFAANNQETDRLWVDTLVDKKTLRDVYFPAFRAAVQKGRALCVMTAYNRLNGVHCSENRWLLEEVLRGEWGFDGVVVSDWGGVHSTKEAALAGLDIEMSVTDNFDSYFFAKPLMEAVRKGEVPTDVLDQKVERILMLMLRLHMLGNGVRRAGSRNTPEHRKILLEAARESVVLLKNTDKALPLRREKLHRILVIGENAVLRHSQGGGSAEINALYEITPLMGLEMALGGNCRVDYCPGYGKEEKESGCGHNWQEDSLQDGGGKRAAAGQLQNAARREEALFLAKQRDVYDAVIFVGGLTHRQDSEGLDRADLALPDGQKELIDALLDIREDLVVVLTGGSCVSMTPWIDRAKAVVWSYYNGMEGGRALAEILLGEVNPSGRLPETFYRSLTDCSAHALGTFGEAGRVWYREKDLVGYRYLEKTGKAPLFPFGYGLSYTEFSYGTPRMVTRGARRELVISVTNTGEMAGKETVEVYREHPGDASAALCGFKKRLLRPGETRTLRIPLPSEKVKTTYRIGSSLLDIRQTLTV
ncbi:MAG: glycoside hydrolase family 3 C-terminal domain-containing protein [Lachnospiraceae bacterium]